MQNIGKFYIKTFGCQMNEYDSQKINNILYKLGYTKTSLQTDADISLITCSKFRIGTAMKIRKHSNTSLILEYVIPSALSELLS